MPIIQSIELQGVLQPQALCIREERQGLPQEEKTETKAQEERSPIIDSVRAYQRRPFPTIAFQLTTILHFPYA